MIFDQELLGISIRVLLSFGVILLLLPAVYVMEYRASNWFQGRPAPHGAGPLGLFQPLADGIKFLAKGGLINRKSNQWWVLLAPVICFSSFVVSFSAIPLASGVVIGGEYHQFVVSPDIPILMFFVTLFGLSVLGVLMAGASSQNHYSILGALRGAGQMMSFLLALYLSLASMVLIFEVSALPEIVSMQKVFFQLGEKTWGIFRNPFAAFSFSLSFFSIGFLKPFDLPRVESERGASYHSEFGSFPYYIFLLTEHLAIVLFSSLFVSLFLGGYQSPILIDWDELPIWVTQISNHRALLEVGIFSSKLIIISFGVIWVKNSLFRAKYDQTQKWAWDFALPFSLFAFAFSLVSKFLEGSFF